MMVPSKARTKIGPKVLKLAKTICFQVFKKACRKISNAKYELVRALVLCS